MKTIPELMTKDPVVIPVANDIQKTIELFLEVGMTSVPVIDNYGKLVGTLTEMNLITAFFRLETRKDGKDKIIHHVDLLEPIETATETDLLSDLIKKMVKAKSHRVVVLDKRGRVVGIISPKDVLKAVTGNSARLTKSQRELQEAREHVKRVLGELENAQQVIGKLQGYLQEAPYMIHSVDSRGKVILSNVRIEAALGYGPGQMNGMLIDELYTADHLDDARAGLRQIMQEGRIDPLRTTMRKKNGDALQVETMSTALHNQKGEFLATITMSRPVTNDMFNSLADAFSESAPFGKSRT